jgi:hypothetical protein
MDPMTWVYIAMIIISLFLASKAAQRPNAKPNSLQDFDVPTAEDGTPIAMAFGDVWFDDINWLDYGNLRSQPIKASGGK